MTQSFDAIIIGAGQAGPYLAEKLSQRGRRTALIERKLLGGTCVNTGCTPTKTMIASADVAHRTRQAARYGVLVSGGIQVSLAEVRRRADEVVAHSRDGLREMLSGLRDCTLVKGAACFIQPGVVRVGADTLRAKQLFINVGGRPSIPRLPGLDQVPFLTSSSILRLTEVPEHLVIVGGGYIGLEFAQMFRRFGAEVTVIEMGPRVASHEDEDVSGALRELLEQEDIRVRLGARCIAFSRTGEQVRVHVDCRAGEPEVVGSHVLLAVGRQPNTDDLGLSEAGIDSDERGYISVNDRLETSAPNVWALGECNGKGAFTHTAYNDFEIVAANVLEGGDRRVSSRIQAHALFTEPPLAQIGMTEMEARRSGRKVMIGKRLMNRVNRAVEKGETAGLIKVLVDAESERIVGASLFGVGADEVVHSLLATMYADTAYSTVQRSVYIHPTVSELLPTLLADLRPLV